MDRWSSLKHALAGAWSVFCTLYLGLRAVRETDAEKVVLTAKHTVTIE